MLRLVLFSLVLVISACAPGNRFDGGRASSEQQVIRRLAGYEAAVLAMNYDLAASFYSESGEVSHSGSTPIRGREAIRKFLHSFAAFKVLEYSVHADSTVVDGQSARQRGAYAQRVVVPDGQIVQVTGKFEALWVLGIAGDWTLARMQTSSSE